MKIVPIVQGTDAWHQFRLTHHGASEAAAMLGLSKRVKRSELVRMKATGLAKEFSQWVQDNLLSRGHEVEARARPLIEEDIAEDLYPVTCEAGAESASCDGLTLGGEFAFEHKLFAVDLAESVRAGVVPEEHMPQCQQILMVTGAEKIRFTVSDGTRANMVWVDVLPDPVWFERLRAGWAQFDKDVAAYIPTEAPEPAKADAMESLPAVSVRLDGALSVVGNLPTFAEALKAFIAKIPTKPATDNEFATVDAACKALKKAEETLDAAEAGALASITDVEVMRRAVADCRKLARDTRLAAEKLVERRKVEMKEQAVMAAKRALTEHVDALSAELAPVRLQMPAVDFGLAIKGLRSIASMQDALDTELANGKIAADAQARVIRANRAQLDAAEASHLFPDFSSVCTKTAEDFGNLITSRKTAAQARIDAERERIRTEELARIEREQRAADEVKAREDAAAQARIDEAARQRAEEERRGAEKLMADAYAAANARAGIDRPYEVYLQFSGGHGEKVPTEKVSEYIAALNSLQPEPNTPEQASPQVLKAEAPAPDATDRDAPAITSPSVGSMGVGQAADAAPSVAPPSQVRAFHPAAAALRNEQPTLSLGDIKTRIAPIAIDAAGLAELGYPSTKVRASCMYRESDWPDIHAALEKALAKSRPQRRAA